MGPATRGAIYHEVQYELLRSGEPTLERLAEILECVAAKWEADLAPAIPQLWRSEVASLHADLRGWLQLREPDWTPQYCELSFGLTDPTGRDPQSRKEPVEVRGFQLRGSIDLVERQQNGNARVGAAGALRGGGRGAARGAGHDRAAALRHHRAELPVRRRAGGRRNAAARGAGTASHRRGDSRRQSAGGSAEGRMQGLRVSAGVRAI